MADTVVASGATARGVDDDATARGVDDDARSSPHAGAAPARGPLRYFVAGLALGALISAVVVGLSVGLTRNAAVTGGSGGRVSVTRTAPSAAAPAIPRAGVLMGGGGVSTPFTSPWAACGKGMEAGPFVTTIRSRLLADGFAAFSAPARGGENGSSGFWPNPRGFSECPETFDASMEINSAAHQDDAGPRLANFLAHLRREHGTARFDLVGYSCGALIGRAAIRTVKEGATDPSSPYYGLRVVSLTTLGGPHQGSYSYDWVAGDIPFQDCLDKVGVRCYTFVVPLAAAPQEGALGGLRSRNLNGPGGWNARQVGALDNITTAFIGGNYFSTRKELFDTRPVVPNDGSVPTVSQVLDTQGVDTTGVLPADASLFRRFVFPVMHSLWVGDAECPLGGCGENTFSDNQDVYSAIVENIRRAQE